MNKPHKTFSVISLVPSLTETLLFCGVPVLGRTRFCIHPKGKVSDIPVVGGTKQVRWDLVRKMNPDLVIIDKEENPKSFLDTFDGSFFISHFDDIETAHSQFCRLSEELPEPYKARMMRISERYLRVHQFRINRSSLSISAKNIPGFIRWVGDVPTTAREGSDILPKKRALYLIWHDPWMTVNQKTFIGTVFKKTGLGSWFKEHEDRYPKIELKDYPSQETVLLCSTEPFPFARKQDLLQSLGYKVAIVDGEALSWFGIRNLKFLEEHLKISVDL